MLSSPKQVNLPEPPAVAIAHSEHLRQIIRDAITQAGGAITFAHFMQLALYAPGFGYYSAGKQKFGEHGDFITAPDISPLFSQCIAHQCQQIFANIKNADKTIMELGAGNGTMAADILLHLEQLDCLPQQYLILELSPSLQLIQQENLQQRCAHLMDKVHVQWLQQLPTEKLKGVIVANEVLDAMPVNKFCVSENNIEEFYVRYDENNNFIWHLDEVSDGTIKHAIEKLEFDKVNLSQDYHSEMNMQLPAWITSLSDILQQGLILLIDYGFPQHEYYHADRSMGTLMCHYHHHAHDDPLQLVGLQDITAHVDFTAIAHAADACHLQVAGYATQAGFLLGCGLEKLMQNFMHDDKALFAASQQIKRLTLPHEMGELFKAIALTRNIENELMGFGFQDLRNRLG